MAERRTRTRKKQPETPTAQLPRVPVDLDLLAHYTDTDRAITAHRAAADISLDEGTLHARAALAGMCNYALTTIALERPGFMGVYYRAARMPVFCPPPYVDPRADTVVLPQLPAPADRPTNVITPPPSLPAVQETSGQQWPLASSRDEVVEGELVDEVPTGEVRPAFVHDPGNRFLNPDEGGEGR